MRTLIVRSIILLGLLFPALAAAVTPMVAAGYGHTVVLQADGTVLEWGYNNGGQLGDGTTAERNSPTVVPGLSGIVAVAAGQVHTVALKSDGTVMAWGWNGQGELGDGTTTNRLSPVAVPGLTGVVAVAAGQYHSVALKSDGTVWTWGYNNSGQLGDGTTTQRNSPTAVSGLTGVVAISAGIYRTVALKSDGTVVTWGDNLGDGTTNISLSPVAVPGLSGVVAVVAGVAHTVALKSDGTLMAWGQNTYGQIGDGTTTQRLSPVAVPGLTGVAAIAAGQYHSVALKSDGTLATWGLNANGTLGDGTTTQHLSPVAVPSLTGVVVVAAGYLHTVALESDGTVMAWGYNAYGQVGDGTTTNRLSPVAVPGLPGVAAANAVDKVSAGGIHTVALKADGTVVAWGDNLYGELGDGTGTTRLSPVAVQGLSGVVAVAAGGYYTAALKSDGTVMAWGWNGYGQLGDGTTTTRANPILVPGLTGVVAVATGDAHTLVLKSDGTVLAWGLNSHGQLGDGTTTQRNSPVAVPGLTGVVAVTAGVYHTVALKSDGTVVAWGDNTYGQLGDGTGTDSSSPVVVPGLTGVVAVSAGAYNTVALKSDGTVVAWGENNYSQLGDGTTTNRLSPVVVPGLTGVVGVATGGFHTVALKSDGTVMAWGWNNYGQLGDGTTTNRLSPVAVPGLTGVVAVAAGAWSTVTLKSDGTVVAWGWNNYGQLGDGTTTQRLSPVGVLGYGGVALAALSYSADAGYGTVGVSPATGTASTAFTYKVVYTQPANIAPSSISVCNSTAVCHAMDVDTSAPATLRDGDYTNGEQYVYTTSLGAGFYNYYFTASDGTNSVSLPSSGNLNGPTVSTLSITTTSLPDGIVGTAYSQTLAVTGGTAPYTFSATSLPTGLTLDTSTGVISGIPTTVGLTGFSVSVTDATSAVFSETISINVVASSASGSGAWITKAPMLTARSGAAGGVINGKLYVVGGSTPTGSTTSAEAYDPVTNTWTAKAFAPASLSYPGSAVINGKLYVVGGCENADCTNGSNKLEEYDPATDTWASKAPMPTARSSVAVGAINGKLYVAGGMQQCVPCASITTLEVYDPATDTWASKASMPTARSHAWGGVVDGQLYVVGGYIDNAVTTTTIVEAYDPVTDTWSTQTPMPTARANPAVEVINGILYAIGGASGITVSESYNPVSDTWSTVAPIPTARYFPSVGIINGVLYVAGSNATNNPLATVEAFTPAIKPMIASGGSATLALRPDGTVWGWGANYCDAGGQCGTFGNGTIIDNYTSPTQGPVFNGMAAVAVAEGHSFSFLLKSDGTVWSSGYNAEGQLGNGTTTDSKTPVQVAGLSGVAAVSAGYSHSMALKSDGTLMAWGFNSHGQLGDGTTTDQHTPVAVPGLTGVMAVSAGYDHTLALKLDGTVVAWGDNQFGQVGDGSTTQRNSPVAVPGLTGVVAVSAGTYHGVALKSDGTVLTWGYNTHGELGDGTTTNRLSPVAVPGLSGVVAVSAGSQYAVALKSDGTVVAWGLNSAGQLGDGTTTDRLSPVAVPGLSGVVAIVAGANFTEVLKSDGTVWSWGSNGNGQLGDGTTTNRLTPVQVTGPGAVGMLDINSTAAPVSAPMATIFQSSLSFGSQSIGSTSGWQAVTLSNPGQGANAALNVSSISISGDFAYMSPGANCGNRVAPFTLAAGDSCDIRVTFTPTAAGTRTGTITVVDNAASSPNVATLSGTGVSALSITTNTLPDGTVGTAYNQTIAVTGGTPPYTFSATSLPAGLTLNASTGAISGTPTTVGMTGFSVTVTDAASVVATFTYSINVSAGSAALGAWTSKAPIPVPSYGLGGAFVNGKFYAISGFATARVGIYNPASDTWTTGAPLPADTGYNLRQFSGVAVLNGMVYVIGGDTGGSGDRDTLLRYDTALDTWTTLAPMPLGARYSLGAAAINGKIYAVGGYSIGSSSYLNRLEVYDPATNTWATKAPMPVAHASALVGAINGKLYVAGGGNIGGQLTELDIYDPVADSWSTGAPVPFTDGVDQPGVVLGGKLFSIGAGPSPSTRVFAYDAATDIWNTNYVPMPTGRGSPGVAADEANNKIYVVGGWLPAGGYASALEVLTLPSKVLVASGQQYNGSPLNTGLTSAEVFDEATGTWSTTTNNIAITPLPYGQMYGSNMVMLDNGKVLIAGAGAPDGAGTSYGTSIYDPATNMWSSSAPMAFGRTWSGMVKLLDGRAMVIGGCAGGCSGPNILGQYVFQVGQSAEIYNPSADSWNTVATLNTVRAGLNQGNMQQPVARLQDGRVLTCNGNDGFSTTYATCEVYDPVANTWSNTGSTPEAFTHRFILLPNGKVLTILNNSLGAILYDPATGIWNATGSPLSLQQYPTLTLLANGEVMMSGGIVTSGSTQSAVNTVQIYNPTTGVWRMTGSMNTARTSHAAVMMADGKVLVSGGIIGSASPGWTLDTNTAEIYDPATGVWTATGSMSQPREYANALLLSGSASPVASASAVSLSTNSLAFASQTVNSTSTQQTVTLTNTGNAVLNIASIVTSGDFARTTTCGATLAAGANCTISVTFTPTVAGARSGALTISTDAAGSPQSVSLSGTGAGINVDLVPTSFSTTASSVNIGDSITLNDTVKNQGTTSTSSAFTVYYYLSTTPTMTSSARPLGSRTISSLGAGASNSASTTFTIPTSVAPGPYYLAMVVDWANTQPETDETNNTLVTAGTITVVRDIDLVPTALSTSASSVNIGDSITLSDTVANQGTTTTSSSFTVSYYLSSDATITGADRFLGSRTISGLAAGASNSASTTFTIPTSVAPGTYYLGVIVDATNTQAETNESNNALATAGTFSVVRDIDLVPTALSASASSVNIGDSVTLSDTAANQGSTTTSGSFTVSYYLSTDATITGADRFLGSRTISSLAAGASSSASTAVTIPTSIAAGTYYLGVIVDSTNTQPETDETNNTRLVPGTLTVVRDIDLVPTALSASASSVNIGDSVTLSDTVANQGTTTTSGSFTVSYYLSTDATITTADRFLGSRTISSLAAGASSSASTAVTIPTSVAAGTYYLGVIVDATNTQAETNEANNALAAAGTITVLRNVDLVPTALSASASSVNIGDSVTLSDTVANQGTTVTSGSFTVSYYLSTDATITTADRSLGSRTISSLAAGASSSASTAVTIPTSIAPGTYYLGVIVDSTNTQAETNEANNALATAGTITVVSNIDLVPTALSTTATTLNIGDSVTLSDTVANQGTTTTSGSFTVNYYLSTDATITTADRPLGSRTISSLGAGASSSASTTFTIPTSIAPGTYYLGVIVDSTNTQAETNEANNTLATAGTITVVSNIDLAPTALSTTASSVNIGDSVTLSDTVSNQGTTVTAGSFRVYYYLSSDATITSADRLLGSRTVNSLDAGASSSASSTFTIPTSVAPGTYYLGVIVDATNTQAESNEANNALATAGTFTVVSNIDLAPTALSTTASSVNIGDSVTLSDTVSNQGTTVTSSSFRVYYYLSSDATITSADRFLGSRVISSLAAGASSSASSTFTIPTSVAPGTYYLGVIVDATNTQAETNESNNALATAGTITVVRNVDLVPSALSTTATSINAGGSITLNDTVTNQGTTVTSSSFRVYYYLSTDATITSADRPLTSRVISSLAAGASNSASTAVTIPTSVAAGTYYLGVIVDSANTQPETDETNNTMATAGVLTVN